VIKVFINRNWEINEEIDFKINIIPLIENHINVILDKEAVPIYHPEEGYILGWKIQYKYE